MHPCPSCQATLQIPPHDFKADAICDRCGGVWISALTLKSTLQSWRIQAKFVESGPSADFCPNCGPIPLDEGTLLGQDGLYCSSCRGVFMRKALKYERVQTTPLPERTSQKGSAQPPLAQSPKSHSSSSQSLNKTLINSKLSEHSKQPSTQVNVQQTQKVNKSETNQSIKTAKPKAPRRLKSEIKSSRKPPSKKVNKPTLPRTKKIKPPAARDLDFNKSDAAWILILLVGIIISLSYWMNP